MDPSVQSTTTQQPVTTAATATIVHANSNPTPAAVGEMTASSNTAATATAKTVTSITMGIKDPCENDVLCGRGGGTNNHIGNERFRILVQTKKKLYLQSSKRDKPLVSREIVALVRSQNPPGRFLGKNPRSGLWVSFKFWLTWCSAFFVRRFLSGNFLCNPQLHLFLKTSSSRIYIVLSKNSLILGTRRRGKKHRKPSERVLQI